MQFSQLCCLAVLITGVMAATVEADEGDQYHLVFNKNQQFEPAKLDIPPGKRVRLIVENQSDIPAEFESFELNREKIVVPHGQVIIYIGPLDPGTYNYFNDFNRATTGTINVH